MLSQKAQASSAIVLMATAFLSCYGFASGEQPQEMREGGLPPVLGEVPSLVRPAKVAAVEQTPRLALSAQETLGALEAANPSTRDNVPGLWYSIGKDGFVREIHGRNLAPDCPVDRRKRRGVGSVLWREIPRHLYETRSQGQLGFRPA